MIYRSALLSIACFAATLPCVRAQVVRAEILSATAERGLAAAAGTQNPSLKAYTLVAFDPDDLRPSLLGVRSRATATAGGGSFRLAVEGGPELTLADEPVELFADDYALVVDDGQTVTRSAGASHRLQVYTGRAYGERTVLVVGDDFVSARLQGPDGGYYLEPAQRLVPDAPAGAYVLYRGEDVIADPAAKCGVETMVERATKLQDLPAVRRAAASGGPCVAVDIKIASAYDTYVDHGSDAAQMEADIAAVFANMVADYAGEFDYDVRFTLGAQYVSTSETSTLDAAIGATTDADQLFAGYIPWAEGADGFGGNYDLATLWIERDLAGRGDTTAVGVAYTGGICTDRARYNIIEDFSSTAWRMRVVYSHEIGHNFNMPHVSGLANIMFPSVTNTDVWDASSVAVLREHVDGAGCGLGDRALVGSPHAEPSGPSSLCLNSETELTDLAYRAPTAWTWSAPGGTLSNAVAQTTTVSYSTTGPKTITLSTSNDACGATESSTESIDVEVSALTPPAATCSPSTSNAGSSTAPGATYGIGITSVSFADVDRASGDSSDDDVAYEDLSCSHIGTTGSTTLEIAVGVGTSAGEYPQRVRVFVDVDNDGFAGNEDMVVDAANVAAGDTVSWTVVLPAGTRVNELLRVRVTCDHTSRTKSGCESTEFGQVEDYSLVVSPPLPVELTYFATEVTDADVRVRWEVADEVDVDQYRLERSRDGERWELAGHVDAAGQTHYHFDDYGLPPGEHYYRLTSVDLDGQFETSRTVVAHVVDAPLAVAARLGLMPNPAADGQTSIWVPERRSDATVWVGDALGRVARRFDIGAGPAEYLRLDLRGEPSGLYTVTFERAGTAPTTVVLRR